MKQVIRDHLPAWLLTKVTRARILFRERKNRGRSASDIFGEIYLTNAWGGAPSEVCSGSGSRDGLMVDSYVTAVSRRLHALGREGVGVMVDLGCGDFAVGSRLAGLGTRYVACDVVPAVVTSNLERYSSLPVEFETVDIITDQLPPGNTAFLRQVLQHLSNDHVARILGRLRAYDRVFITEHQPAPSRLKAPNRDKYPGGSTRVDFDSGVFLTKPPFSLPESCLELILEVPVSNGAIVTWEYTPV